MKIIFFSILTLIFFGCKQNNTTMEFDAFSFDTTTQHILFEGELTDVFVEKNIYSKTGEENFFLKFTIVNKTDSLVGVDLTDFWRVLYPNQWGIYSKPYREVVDERQIIPDSSYDKSFYFNKFKNNQLTIIQPYQKLVYFRIWNGSGEKPELKNSKEFLLISIDGQLFCTNGKIVEHFNFSNSDEKQRVLVIGYPLENVLITNNSLIIKNKN